jgi:hypothetical protein
VPGSGKAAHVGADLSDHGLGGAFGDAGDRGGRGDARCERAELLPDRVREPVDVLIQEVQVGEDRADHQCVVGLEAALQRLAQLRQLLRSLPLASSASTAGSVVPATSASSIARDRRRRECRWRRGRA